MRPASLKDCSRAFLETMAGFLGAEIAAGRTANADGRDLVALRAEVCAAIPLAPDYSITYRLK